MRYILASVLAAAMLSFFPLSSEADVTLVKDGKANAVIIVSDELQAQQAAAEIQKYIQQISGATLQIIKETEANGSGLPVTIAVGHTQLAAKAGVKIPSGFKEVVGDPNVFEEEGFVLKTSGNTVFVGGNSDGPYQGTTYAGYALLEKLGCRFFFPGQWGEVIPSNKTVILEKTDVNTRPDFAMRNVSLGGWIPATKEQRATYAEWGQKVRFSAGQFYPIVGDGFLAYLVPPREFQEKDQSLYAMDAAGSRKQPLYENHAMLSLINPKTFELAVQNLKEAFAGTRKMRIVSPNGVGISPPDGSAYDFDPEAVKNNQNFNYPTYIHHPQTSEEFFGFASRLAREFPDKWVATMAYAGREMPPQGVSIPKNLTVLYAPIASCVMHPGNDPACWRRIETIEIMRQWCKLTPHVYLYDYNPGFLLGSFLPERDVANFAVNVKLYKDMKLKGFKPEGRKAFMQTWISYYVRSKLMWDANADVEAIKKDFYEKFFGPEAGPHVQAWWDACEAVLYDTTLHAHEDWLLNRIYTVAFTQKIHKHVEAAGKAKMTPKQRARFEAFALIADHLEGYAAMEKAEENLDYVEAGRQAQRMEDDNAKLISIYEFFLGDKYHPGFTNGRVKKYAKLADMLNGKDGTMVAPIPLESKFRRDLYNEGVIAQWYLTGFDDKSWGTKNTYVTWDAQDKPEDAKGHDYDGYGWYRMTVNVPADAVDKPLKLHLGGVINEGWVWVNGEYAGHRGSKIWWSGRTPLEMDVDVTGKVKAGANVITLRVLNSAEIGGLFRRGFVWSPNPTPVETPAKTPAKTPGK